MSGIPGSWRSPPLSDLLEVSIGGVWGGEPGSADVDVRVIRVTELKEFGRIEPSSAALRSISVRQLESRELQDGDILVEKSGGGPTSPVGRVGLVTGLGSGFVCANFMQLMRVNEGTIDRRYLFHFLNYFHMTGQTAPMQTATTNIRNIKMPEYLRTPVPLGSIDEQRLVVSLVEEQVSRLDAALASVRTVREKSKAFRRSLLHAAFSGELAGRVEERGAVPPRWRQFNFGDVVEFLSGYAFKSEWYIPNGVRLVRGQNISHGRLDWADTRSVSRARASEFKRFDLNVGDLVLAMDRPLISTGLKWAVLREEDVPSLLLQRVVRLTAKETVIAPKFLQFWIQSPFFTTGINPGRSIGVPHISTKELGSLSLCLPPLEEQYHIVSVLEEQFSRLDAALAIANQLEARIASERRSLLHAAFSGTLTTQWRDTHHG